MIGKRFSKLKQKSINVLKILLKKTHHFKNQQQTFKQNNKLLENERILNFNSNCKL